MIRGRGSDRLSLELRRSFYPTWGALRCRAPASASSGILSKNRRSVISNLFPISRPPRSRDRSNLDLPRQTSCASTLARIAPQRSPNILFIRSNPYPSYILASTSLSWNTACTYNNDNSLSSFLPTIRARTPANSHHAPQRLPRTRSYATVRNKNPSLIKKRAQPKKKEKDMFPELMWGFEKDSAQRKQKSEQNKAKAAQAGTTASQKSQQKSKKTIENSRAGKKSSAAAASENSSDGITDEMIEAADRELREGAEMSIEDLEKVVEEDEELNSFLKDTEEEFDDKKLYEDMFGPRFLDDEDLEKEEEEFEQRARESRAEFAQKPVPPPPKTIAEVLEEQQQMSPDEAMKQREAELMQFDIIRAIAKDMPPPRSNKEYAEMLRESERKGNVNPVFLDIERSVPTELRGKVEFTQEFYPVTEDETDEDFYERVGREQEERDGHKWGELDDPFHHAVNEKGEVVEATDERDVGEEPEEEEEEDEYDMVTKGNERKAADAKDGGEDDVDEEFFDEEEEEAKDEKEEDVQVETSTVSESMSQLQEENRIADIEVKEAVTRRREMEEHQRQAKERRRKLLEVERERRRQRLKEIQQDKKQELAERREQALRNNRVKVDDETGEMRCHGAKVPSHLQHWFFDPEGIKTERDVRAERRLLRNKRLEILRKNREPRPLIVNEVQEAGEDAAKLIMADAKQGDTGRRRGSSWIVDEDEEFGRTRRQVRVEAMVKTRLEEVLMEDMQRSKLLSRAEVGIEDISITRDLKRAIVVWSSEREQDIVEQTLYDRTPLIRGLLASRANLKHTPEIHFMRENSENKYNELVQRLNKLAAEEGFDELALKQELHKRKMEKAKEAVRKAQIDSADD